MRKGILILQMLLKLAIYLEEKIQNVIIWPTPKIWLRAV